MRGSSKSLKVRRHIAFVRIFSLIAKSLSKVVTRFQVKNDSLLVVRILHEKMSIERHFAKGRDDSDA